MLQVIMFSILCTSSLATFPLERSEIAIRADGLINYRLPTYLKPVHYDITVEPFFSPDFEFKGQVSIEVNVLENTSTITLHCNELSINRNSIKVSYANGLDDSINVTNFNIDSTRQFCIIELLQEVRDGSVLNIDIEYRGILNENNKGFYRASYEDEDGNIRWLGTTQFESTSARQAFPCFDEPALKATFTINVIRKEGYTSISNMNIKETVNLNYGRFMDIFEKSVKMPTYLVAFVVSDFANHTIENQAVFAKKQLIDDGRGEYGVSVGINTLEVMENFTNVKYSLDKMFQVAIPNDWFAAGAMENWGLVTYKERYILYKDGITTSSEKQSIASIIAHEFGHQWFGNLVSPLWWKYIWLNEGFATYFEYYATSVVETDMRMMEQFVIKTNQYAFESDSLETTRPMSFDAESPSEIAALFDRIAYDKSGAVIRMMEHFLTTPVFVKGLTIYLNNKAYDAAEPTDLWTGLQAAVDQEQNDDLQGMTIAEIMETWNSQAGYPVVYVERDNTGTVKFSQSRYLLNNATHDLNQTWTIPINYVTSQNPIFTDTTVTYWLKEAEETTDIVVENDYWIIVNKKETGYYRVNYDEANWNLLVDYLNSENYDKIDVLNRAQLIDDAFNLARSGRIPYSIPLRLIEYVSRETDYIPLYSFFTGISQLDKMLSGSKNYYLFKRYIKSLLQTAYETLGTEDTGTHTEKLNRINVIKWLCKFDDENCQQAMHDKLSSFVQIPPDLQDPVYCGGMRLNNNTFLKHTWLYSRYSEDVSEDLEKTRLATGMGCTTDVDILRSVLDSCIDDEFFYTLRASDKTAVFSSVYTNSDVGLEIAYNFFIDYFEKFRENLTYAQISTILNGMSGRLTLVRHKNQFISFVNYQVEDIKNLYENVFKNAFSNIESNINWNEKYLESINSWLETYYGITYPSTILTTPRTTEITQHLTTPETTPTTIKTTPTTIKTTPTTIKTTPKPGQGDDEDGGGANVFKFSFSLLLGSFILIQLFK